MPEVERRYLSITATIPSGGSLSGPVDVRPYAGGAISVPAAWTAANVAFQHSAAIDGTYQPLYDDTGALIQLITTAGHDYALPDRVFGCAYLKVWSESGGAGVAQGADRPVIVFLKG